MSDVLSDVNMYLSEPDETVLTAALRNKDDIPILMDIVGDDAPLVSQETYFQKTMGGTGNADSEQQSEPVRAAQATTPNSAERPAQATQPPQKKPALEHANGTANVAKKVKQVAQNDALKGVAKSVSTAKAELNSNVTKTTSATQSLALEASKAQVAAQQTAHADVLAEAIQAVLERKLPEIVHDVMMEIAKREQH